MRGMCTASIRTHDDTDTKSKRYKISDSSSCVYYKHNSIETLRDLALVMAVLIYIIMRRSHYVSLRVRYKILSSWLD